MKRTLGAACCSLVAALAMMAAAAEHTPGPRIKFIELGWDIPDTAFLRQHWRYMEEHAPFDGVMFRLEAKGPEGKTRSTQRAWNKEPWSRDWFAGAVADLKSCRFTKFTDNFIRLNATPGNLDWADDEGWAALADKVRICGWVAREGGGKGLAVDFESYGAKQFRFDPTLNRGFADTAKLARGRGAQFTAALAEEMPQAVILGLWLNSINLKAGRSEDAAVILAGEQYGLLPAFIDGMLDALPLGMVLVDGCEHGYYMDGAEEYLRAAHEMRSWNGGSVQLVAPENRATYRRRVQAGFGFYLDMYLNPEGHRYYFGPLEGSRLKRLHRNLVAARQAADEYVWIYGEQCRWWPGPMSDEWMEGSVKTTTGKGRLWEDALPGLTRAIVWARDPVSAARAELAAGRNRGALTNLAINPGFDAKPGATPNGLPVGYSAWQDEKNRTGTFSWEEKIGGGSGCARKVMWGCFLQKHAAIPGETYTVEVECRSQGATQTSLMVRWQKPDGQWTRWHDDQTFVFRPGGGEWQEAFGVVTVPPEVGQLVILLNVRGQLSAEDVCWFDNVGLYRMPPLTPDPK